jgi:N-methylhydantoinase A
VETLADMRYTGQGHEITVCVPSKTLSAEDLATIEANFKQEYHLRYGRVLEQMPIESVTWRVILSGPIPQLIPQQAVLGDHKQAQKGERLVFWGERYELTPVYDRYAMRIDHEYPGPCIIEEHESTTVVGKASRVRIDAHKNIIISLD